jgi:hypothetical protein
MAFPVAKGIFFVNGDADLSGLLTVEMEFLRSAEGEERIINEKLIEM